MRASVAAELHRLGGGRKGGVGEEVPSAARKSSEDPRTARVTGDRGEGRRLRRGAGTARGMGAGDAFIVADAFIGGRIARAM